MEDYLNQRQREIRLFYYRSFPVLHKDKQNHCVIQTSNNCKDKGNKGNIYILFHYLIVAVCKWDANGCIFVGERSFLITFSTFILTLRFFEMFIFAKHAHPATSAKTSVNWVVPRSAVLFTKTTNQCTIAFKPFDSLTLSLAIIPIACNLAHLL